MLRFNQRLTLQTNTPIGFKGGCYTESWATATTFWGNLGFDSSSENYDKVKAQDTNKVKILTRQRTDVDKATCRLLYNDNIIHIETVDNFYRNKYTLIKGRCDNG